MNNRVLPVYASQNLLVLKILTDIEAQSAVAKWSSIIAGFFWR